MDANGRVYVADPDADTFGDAFDLLRRIATFADGIAAELTTANPPSFEGG